MIHYLTTTWSWSAQNLAIWSLVNMGAWRFGRNIYVLLEVSSHSTQGFVMNMVEGGGG